MAVSYLRNTPITGKSYTTPVDATNASNSCRDIATGQRHGRDTIG
ncbi:hypothetical protein ACQEUX_16385 [Micromonospora sp. CA-259024]